MNGLCVLINTLTCQSAGTLHLRTYRLHPSPVVAARTQIHDQVSNTIVIMHLRQSASAALQFHIATQQIK